MNLKKISSLTIMLLMLAPPVAWGYDFDDTTLVQPWEHGSPTNDPWVDVVGGPLLYDTFGANYSGGTFTIFTNWNPYKSSGLIRTADLFIDLGCDGTWDYAVQLDTLTQVGNVYADPDFSTSDDIFKSTTTTTYGGRYDEAAPKAVPVLATSGLTNTTAVVWTITDLHTGLNNQVAVDLTNIVGSNNYGFVWGTATCANDGFAACQVPLPSSVLLIGFGLLRLAAYKRRKSSRT